MTRMLVLKLGGSLLTDKTQPYSLRIDVLRSASAEIKTCFDQGLIQKLLIVHGVGSYGHPPVIQYKLHKGFIDPSQLLPLSRTQSKVNELRLAITASLQEVGIPVNLFHTSSIATARKGRIINLDIKAIKGFLDIGMVPVLGGDMVYDEEMGFSVGSGDQVAAILAKELGATDLVFATDVVGVYDKDPKKAPNARLLRNLSLCRLDELASSSGGSGDASGAMKGKLSALSILEQELRDGLKMSIISMMETGRLLGLLKGELMEATNILV
jgi:isopentenyl phosphate kinase